MAETVKTEELVEKVADKAEKQEKTDKVVVTKKYRKTSKKKVCAFCVAGEKSIDSQDVAKIRKFITEKGKILPRRQTGVCAYHQRELCLAIKRARNIALLPYVGD